MKAKPLPAHWAKMKRESAGRLKALKDEIRRNAKEAKKAAERAKRQAYWAAHTPKPAPPERSTHLSQQFTGKPIGTNAASRSLAPEAQWIADNGWSSKQ